ncbi:LD-carboxypeptidase [Tenericutes bacterium MO-XQ]|nr:LD-carboxypeptidase [Tenericutes bacterium MO-XQ]
MNKLIKPKKLNPGDTVAAVSLSWGGAGDPNITWRYDLAKKRLKELFDINLVEMPHTLKSPEFVYNHPKERAMDLMAAFKDPNVKAIFSTIGGDDSIRMLPYIDFDVIKNNPKIFIGYSDTTVTHFMCLKAGISSFYGPSLLAEFAENVTMHDYTLKHLEKSLFDTSIIGEIKPSSYWIDQHLRWDASNKDIKRHQAPNEGYELLQGKDIVRGRLIGGCIEVLEMIKGTTLWPSLNEWNDTILFLETSEEKPTPDYIEYWLRNYGAIGILDRIKGIVIGKPFEMKYYDEYKQSILKIVRDEYKLKDLPILYNLNFGHTAPMITIPYGAKATIDCEKKTLIIDDTSVAD